MAGEFIDFQNCDNKVALERDGNREMLEHLPMFSCDGIDVIKKLHLRHFRRTQGDARAFLMGIILLYWDTASQA
jgi:hypothetical protein